MTEVISVKFKNRGKSYFFAPNGKTVKSGEQVIVETSKGLESPTAAAATTWSRIPPWCSRCALW